MAIIRANLASRAALAEWLQANAVPKYFASVTYTDSKIQGFDEDGNKLLEITSTGGIYAYSSANSYQSWTSDYSLIGSRTINLIACDNGVLFENTYSGQGGSGKIMVAIAKTNNGKTAFIFSANSSSTVSGYYTELRHTAWGDSPTVTSTTTFVPEQTNQTELQAFLTNVEVGGTSYTPDAGYMPAHTLYASGINKFILGADTYITNGYWYIKDGGAA